MVKETATVDDDGPAEGSQKEARFSHLLQPIRDLAENWNIDVASELEDYLNEVCFESR